MQGQEFIQASEPGYMALKSYVHGTRKKGSSNQEFPNE
jgi:hypothetical protein